MPDPTDTLPPGPVTTEQLLLRSMRDAAEQRRDMTAAIDRLSAAMAEHNRDAGVRSQALLEALRARDAGTAAAVGQLAAVKSEDRAWARAAASRVGAEIWPLLRVPLGLALAYYGARWSGALPSLAQPSSLVTVSPQPIAAAPGAAQGSAATASPPQGQNGPSPLLP